MRRRVSALLYDTYGLNDFAHEFEKELGLNVGARGWHHLLASCALQDLLDMVTVAHRFLLRQERSDRHGLVKPAEWIHTIRRIFAEENIQYSVDNRGGVHFAFDAEFEINRAATVSALNGTRYTNVRTEFAGIDTALSETPPNGKDAIRSAFTAAEGLFRLMFPSSPRLTAAEIKAHLPKIIEQVNSSDQTALRATLKAVGSFEDWTEAAHFYRHEPGQQEIAQPPLNLAVYLVSQGASHIRWLAEIDEIIFGRPNS